MSTPSVFHDFRPDDFPFTIEFLDAGTGELVHSETVTGPGAVKIDKQERPVDVRVTYPDGRESIARFDDL